MPYFKYRMTLQYKNKGEPDQYFRKWDAVKAFPALSMKSPFLSMISTNKDRDGYRTTRIGVYQDNYDFEAYTDKMIISDKGLVVIEADNASIFDKLAIVWLKCTCTTSPDYRLRLDFVEETNEAPTHVKMLPSRQ